MKIIKRHITVFLMLAAFILLLGNGIETRASSGTSSLSVSSSSVNIGDTVTVTMKVSADEYASFRMSLSYDSSVLEYTGSDKGGDCNGGGGALSVLSEVESGSTYSIQCTFKAKAPGNAGVSASTVEAIAMETAEAMSISGSSTSVTVNNQAAGNDTPDNNGGNTGNENNGNANAGNQTPENNTGTQTPTPTTSAANLSRDNSLKRLAISPGTLSPAFKYSTTNYTATVSEEVTGIAVDAQPSNANATVQSVTGNTSLQMGANTVQVVVKAENGTLATYTITVTRGGTAALEEAPEEEIPEEDSMETGASADTGIMINGVSYKLGAVLPADVLPAEFVKTTATYGEETVEAYTFPYLELVLFYLEPVNAAGDTAATDTAEGAATTDTTEGAQPISGGFFFYNASAGEFFPYINIPVGEKYVLVLPMSFAGAVPEGYQEAAVTMGQHKISGYQPIPESAETANEFYLVYGVDQYGTAGWYEYDSADMSLQRFHQVFTAPAEEVVDTNADEVAAYAARYQELEAKYQEEQAAAKTRTTVLVVLLIAVVVIMIGILIFGGRGRNNGRKSKNMDLDYIDFDDL